jgi:hypothetical protein
MAVLAGWGPDVEEERVEFGWDGKVVEEVLEWRVDAS